MSNSSIPETPLQKEIRLFTELFSRLFDAVLNRLFDLRPEKAHQRRSYLVFLFIVSGFVISLLVVPEGQRTDWGSQISSLFRFLLNRQFALDQISQGINHIDLFISAVWNAYTNPHTLQYLPIILAPFFIALHAAGLYLADIFELSDVTIARKFIMEVSLTGSDETIRITKGDVLEEHKTSPNYLIGGPGKVIVDLDSVALFEKPDGTPHIIGPTGKEKGGKATLEGFERFRQAIDIRDHFVELRDQDTRSPSVKSRSLDGIPVTATDVKLMYSVNRDGKKPSKEEPYPFNVKAIEKLVYSAGSTVTIDQFTPSAFKFSWTNNMVGLIRGKLGGFMSEKNLTVYLASIGQPEFEKAQNNEKVIANDARQIIPPEESIPETQGVKAPPEFTPRHKITNLFSQFALGFVDSARERGVELHWMSVGTWKTPIENVYEKHLEAWKISRENLIQGQEETMKQIQRNAELHKKIASIQALPLFAYQEVKENYPERDNAIKGLLLEYQRFLKDQFDLLQKIKLPIPPTLVAAIFYIDKMLSHKLYPPPPAPKTQREKELYANLLGRVRFHEAVEKLLEIKADTQPQASREDLLMQVIRDWDHDMETDK